MSIRTSSVAAWALGAALIATPALASAGKAKAPKVAVIDFPAEKTFDANTNHTLTEFYANDLRQQGLQVITSADVGAALGIEKQKELLGCSDSNCMAELGGAMGADYIARGTVAVLDGQTAISLTLQDARGQEINRIGVHVPGVSPSLLLGKLEEMVPQLVQPLRDSGKITAVATIGPAATPAAGLEAQRKQAFETKRDSASRFRTIGYATGAAGGVVLGVGAVFAVMSNGAYSNASNGSLANGTAITNSVSSGRTEAAVADVLMGVGVVGAAAGVALVLTDLDPGPYTVQVAINPLSHSAMATLTFP